MTTYALLKQKLNVFFRSAKHFLSPTVIMEDILKPPRMEGLTKLDKSLFTKNVCVLSLKISMKDIQQVLPTVKPVLLKLPNFKPVLYSPEDAKVLLNPKLISQWEDLDPKLIDKLNTFGCTKHSLEKTQITLKYENFNVDDILRSIIPLELDIARGFSAVGHILHLNLRDCLLPYKKVIGEVLLDKTPRIKSVVNKTTAIDNTYRNFQMELVCGIDDMITKVKENGRIFEFDFSQVYWNSRLSTEHQRIVDLLKPNDVLFDVFSGVGPFAIPAAKKKCFVYANDLNPHSYKWLNHNVKLNKVLPALITTFNKDGKDFIREDIKNQLLGHNNFEGKVHVVMNLPALALEFVTHFKNLFNPDDVIGKCVEKIRPAVHVYFFVSGTELKQSAFADFYRVTGIELPESEIEYHYVRNVSPKKDMVRLTLNMPWTYMLAESDCPPAKRQCIDSEKCSN